MPVPASKLPPGPKGHFLLGSTRELARDWPGFCARCARDFGDIAYYRFLRVPICQFTHPDDIETVLVRQAANFHKSRDYAALEYFLGNGLLTNDSPSWQSQRQLIQPAFRHENISAYAGIMSGPGSMTLIGGGVLNLTGNSTYTGATNVNAGTLLVNGSLASTVYLVNGGILGGNGVIGALQSGPKPGSLGDCRRWPPTLCYSGSRRLISGNCNERRSDSDVAPVAGSLRPAA